MGRGSDLLYNPPIIKKGEAKNENETLFLTGTTFPLPAQARDLFSGDDHLLLTDARGHLLRFQEEKESGGHLLDDLGPLGSYAEEISYAAGNLVALEEDDAIISLLFARDVEKSEDSLNIERYSAKYLFGNPSSYSLQATVNGAYIYDRDNKMLLSCLFNLPGGPDDAVWSEEEESVFAFSPSGDGALYFQKHKDGPLRPRYIDSRGEFHLLGGDWRDEGFIIAQSVTHARQGDTVYFTYQTGSKQGTWKYPLYFSQLDGTEGGHVTYLKDRVKKLQPFADSLLVFYENGELDILENGTLMKSERLPEGEDHMMLNKTLLFLPRKDYRKSLAIHNLNEAESARQGLRLEP